MSNYHRFSLLGCLVHNNCFFVRSRGNRLDQYFLPRGLTDDVLEGEKGRAGLQCIKSITIHLLSECISSSLLE